VQGGGSFSRPSEVARKVFEVGVNVNIKAPALALWGQFRRMPVKAWLTVPLIRSAIVLHHAASGATIVPKNAYINARVDRDLKAKAEKVLRRVGVSTTEVVTMLLHQIVLRKGVPFDVRIPNEETRRAMAELDRGAGEKFDGAAEGLVEKIVGSRK
jgi:DNA-damage-inducible protein J